MNTTHMRIPSNRVADIERYCHAELAGLYPEGEIRAMTRLLFEGFLDWNLTALLLHRNDTINQSDLLKFHWAVEDLKRYRPIQHIVGYAEFCGCRIAVSPDVLIPRPETEEIVNYACQSLDGIAKPKVLDLCTGSGCIAIALAKMLSEAVVWGVDISDKALAVATRNNEANGTGVQFRQGDVLGALPTIGNGCFDLIISNPPYIKEEEMAEMQPNVLNYEPSLALFVPNNDPLLFYRAIGHYALQHLEPNGLLVLEINEHLATETLHLLRTMGFKAICHHDYRGKDRMVVCLVDNG